MHISALSIALLSIVTLAASLDTTTSSLPSSSIDNSTTTDPSPLDKRRPLGGQLTAWDAPDCTAVKNSDWDGKVTKLYPGCIKFAPQHEYIMVNLNFGVLRVFRDENCQELVKRVLTPKMCMKKGEDSWGSVRLLKAGRTSV